MPQGQGNKWTGVLPVAISDFTDRSGEYDWADLFLSIEVMIEGSEYTRKLEIAGTLEKDANGNITGGKVLTRLYKFFEVLGFQGGLTAQGTWEDVDGVEIEKIDDFLNERYLTGNPMEADYKYVTYVYKQKPKQVGGTVFTRCLPKIALNNDEGKKEITSQVDWMRSKGYLKEMTDTPDNPSTVPTSAADNL